MGAFELPGAQNSVFSCLGDTELHDPLGSNLDGLARSWIPAHTGFAIDQDEFAQTGDCERVLSVLVCQRHKGFDGLNGLLFREADCVCDGGGDLGFG